MKEIINTVEDWLQAPVADDIDACLEKSETLLEKLQQALSHNQDERQTLGPLIGKVKGIQKKLQNLEIINWVSVANGHLAIGHRPSVKMMGDLKLQGASHILTLLCESEGADEISKLCGKENLEWLWFSMKSANPPIEERQLELKTLFSEMSQALEKGAKIYVHCSAGIHRTGMISYAFLRYTGLTQELAKDILMKLRQETGLNVGADRLAWADTFSSKLV